MSPWGTSAVGGRTCEDAPPPSGGGRPHGPDQFLDPGEYRVEV